MKFLVFIAAMSAGVTLSQYSVEFSPDEHAAIWAPCDMQQSEIEDPFIGMNTHICVLSRTIPFDGIDCFFNALKIAKKSDEEETLAHAKS